MQLAESSDFRARWREALSHKRFIGWLIFAFGTILMLALFVEWYFQNVILHRHGSVLNDFVLNLFIPFDWSFGIMGLIYSGALIALTSNSGKPWNLVLLLSTYAVVTWLRMITMFVFTLEAPEGVIPLTDPFLAALVYSKSSFVKDLFFSGHVSSLCVCWFVEQNKVLRWILGAMTILMSIMILWQHVHYTIDVVFAPVFTYIVMWTLKNYFLKRPL